MSRPNLAGDFWGESQRLTVRVSSRELRALDELTDAWGADRSEAIRRALREAAAGVRRQRRQALLAALPTAPSPNCDVSPGTCTSQAGAA